MIMSVIAATALLVSTTAANNIAATAYTKHVDHSVTPSADLTAAEAIRAQLRALQHDDVAGCFAFASPANRAVTGPLPRFEAMIRGGYSDMLEAESYTVSDSAGFDTEAADAEGCVEVAITKASAGSRYRWCVRRQPASFAECRGCWMTDSVMPIERPAPVRQSTATPTYSTETNGHVRSAPRIVAPYPRSVVIASDNVGTGAVAVESATSTAVPASGVRQSHEADAPSPFWWVTWVLAFIIVATVMGIARQNARSKIDGLDTFTGADYKNAAGGLSTLDFALKVAPSAKLNPSPPAHHFLAVGKTAGSQVVLLTV